MKRLLLLLLGAITLLSAYSQDRVTMLTRDGKLHEINLEHINNDEVQYYVKKTRVQGYSSVENAYRCTALQTTPKEEIFMIKYENGNTIFFLEDGTQVSRKSEKVRDNDDVLYLRDGQEVVVRQLRLNGKEVTFKAPSRKNNEVYAMPTDQIFMIRHSDGYCDVFGPRIKSRSTASPEPPAMAGNRAAQNTPRAPQQSTHAPQATSVDVSPSAPSMTVGVPSVSIPGQAQAETPAQPSIPAQVPTSLSQAHGVFPEKVVDLVYASNPYTLYKRNATAEYTFSQNNKPIKYCGAAYLLQSIIDTRVEDGLYIAYLQQDILDEHHQRPTTVDERYSDCIFVTEIDTAGTFNWTHDPIRTQMVVEKKRGYASLIHNYLTPGPLRASKMELTGSSHTTAMKGNKGSAGVFALGAKPSTILYDYTGLKVEGFERISTPCGDFDCVRISGHVPGQQANGNVKTSRTTIWLSRGIGIVRYDIDIDNNGQPITMMLNNIYNN